MFIAENDSKSGFGSKILSIGVSAAGGLLLLIILILVIVLARRRTRKRRQYENGETPLQVSYTRERSNDVVMRGISSIRSGPPQSQLHLAGESMTERLVPNLPHDAGQDAVATFKPRGSFARVKAENTTLLPTEDYSEESKLRVHFNEGQGKVEEGSAGRLYDTIGCPPGNSKNALKCDVRQRCEANASPQGHIYQNVQESEHLYDTLNKFR